VGNVRKPTISIDATLYEDASEAASKAGLTFSAWLSEAARTQLRQDSLQAAITDYEAEDGPFSDEEIAGTAVAEALREAGRTKGGTQAKPRRRAS
jgi:hypothetical protein